MQQLHHPSVHQYKQHITIAGMICFTDQINPTKASHIVANINQPYHGQLKAAARVLYSAQDNAAIASSCNAGVFTTIFEYQLHTFIQGVTKLP
eukprot:2473378-Rhodomonas_salina.1